MGKRCCIGAKCITGTVVFCLAMAGCMLWTFRELEMCGKDHGMVPASPKHFDGDVLELDLRCLDDDAGQIHASERSVAFVTIVDLNSASGKTRVIPVGIAIQGRKHANKWSYSFEAWEPIDGKDGKVRSGEDECDPLLYQDVATNGIVSAEGEDYEDYVLEASIADHTLTRDRTQSFYGEFKLPSRLVDVVFSAGGAKTYEGAYILIARAGRRAAGMKSNDWLAEKKRVVFDAEAPVKGKSEMAWDATEWLVEYGYKPGENRSCFFHREWKFKYPKCEYVLEHPDQTAISARLRSAFIAIETADNTADLEQSLNTESWFKMYAVNMILQKPSFMTQSEYFIVEGGSTVDYVRPGPLWDLDHTPWYEAPVYVGERNGWAIKEPIESTYGWVQNTNAFEGARQTHLTKATLREAYDAIESALGTYDAETAARNNARWPLWGNACGGGSETSVTKFGSLVYPHMSMWNTPYFDSGPAELNAVTHFYRDRFQWMKHHSESALAVVYEYNRYYYVSSIMLMFAYVMSATLFAAFLVQMGSVLRSRRPSEAGEVARGVTDAPDTKYTLQDFAMWFYGLELIVVLLSIFGVMGAPGGIGAPAVLIVTLLSHFGVRIGTARYGRAADVATDEREGEMGENVDIDNNSDANKDANCQTIPEEDDREEDDEPPAYSSVFVPVPQQYVQQDCCITLQHVAVVFDFILCASFVMACWWLHIRVSDHDSRLGGQSDDFEGVELGFPAIAISLVGYFGFLLLWIYGLGTPPSTPSNLFTISDISRMIRRVSKRKPPRESCVVLELREGNPVVLARDRKVRFDPAATTEV